MAFVPDRFDELSGPLVTDPHHGFAWLVHGLIAKSLIADFLAGLAGGTIGCIPDALRGSAIAAI